ncbi:MAG: hypothetical protein HQ521_00780 [Bacteroidetes bacterium]|nr:hypothetical protein [Bacteroidota bacterium]
MYNKYHKLAYKYYFLKSDLLRAYKYKIEQAINLEIKTENDNKRLASNYLDIIINEELIDLINLNKEDIVYLKNRRYKNNFNLKKKEMGELGKILIIGPSFSEGTTINVNKYEYVAFNKPPINNVFDIPTEKIIVILNNQWSIGKFRNESIQWIKENDFAKVFTPNPLKCKKENIKLYSINAGYLSASPMGLQRAINVLLSNINPQDIEIIGYDFQLSKKPYNSWYPSGITFFHETFFEGWLYSNLHHDFLFNYMYLKKLKQQFGDKIHGSIDPYLEMSIGDVIDLFEKRMKALRD